MANDIERKALELVNEVTVRHRDDLRECKRDEFREALCRAIEQHEAFRQEVEDALLEFRQEVSDAVSLLVNGRALTAAAQDVVRQVMSRFIIAKPDPLAKLIDSIAITLDADDLRAALDEAGLEIREKGK